MRRVLAGVLLVAASGCIVDGIYAVRGTVWRNEPERTPVAGASVAVRGCAPYPPNKPALAGSDGKYDVQCWMGGMCFLLWCPGMGVPDTTVDFVAQGYRPKTVRLLGKESDAQVSRLRCEPNCVQIDVTLEPEGDGPIDGH